jgi:hypothetical protein
VIRAPRPHPLSTTSTHGFDFFAMKKKRAFTIYDAMGRLVRTSEGKHLVSTFEELRALVRAHQGRKGASKSKAASAPAANATPATK